MAFCLHCGKELSPEESKAKFCIYCGQELDNEENTAKTPIINVDKEALSQKIGDVKGKVAGAVNNVDKKKLPLFAGIAAAAVVVIVLLFVLLGSSPKDPVKNMLKAFNKGDYDKLVTMEMPDFRADKYNSYRKVYRKYVDDAQDDYEDAVEDLEEVYEDAKDEYKFKLSFEFGDVKTLKDSKVEDIQDVIDDSADYYEDTIDDLKDILEDEDDLEDWADDMDVDEKEAKKLIKARIKYLETFVDLEVKAAKEIKGKFIHKVDGKEYESDRVTITVIKVKGDWYIYGMEGSMYPEDLEDDDYEDLEKYLEYLGWAF